MPGIFEVTNKIEHLFLCFDLLIQFNNASGTYSLSISNIIAEQAGIMYIYLSNESTSPQYVFFDNFDISVGESPILESSDYYPFGLTFNSYTKPGTTDQKYKYQSKEEQEELSTIDFEARMYDPALGRTWQIDPHSENYFSLSSYSFFANNPLLFIDPTGKDINFYVWENNEDGELKRKKINFDQLDKNIQNALEAFAKTDAGNSFLSQFAKPGDKVGSVLFTEEGINSKHEMGFAQISDEELSPGYSGSANTRTTANFYIKINTEREEKSIEAYALTLGHEAFIHLGQFTEDLIKAIENNDVKAYYAILAERKRIAYDRDGGPEHDGYIEGRPEYSRMRGFINQLKSVLNPAEVNKQIQKHDSKLKAGKK